MKQPKRIKAYTVEGNKQALQSNAKQILGVLTSGMLCKDISVKAYDSK